MIFKGEKKAVIFKGDFHPAQFYKGDKKITGYSLEEFISTDKATLENCYNDKVYDVQISSKNLLDVKKVYLDFVNDEGGITFTRRNLTVITNRNMYSNYKVNTAYTFSCGYEITAENNSVYPVVTYTDGTYDSNWAAMGGTITGTKSGHCKITTTGRKTVKNIGIGYSTATRTMDVKLTNMMLVEGATAKEYEPPCREATITAKGKNLLDVNKAYPDYANNEGGITYANSNMPKIHNVNMLKEYKDGVQYTVSMNYVVEGNTGNSVSIQIIHTDGTNTRKYITVNTSGTLSISSIQGKTVSTIIIGYSTATVLCNVKLTNMQIEEGATATECEPYIEPQTIPFENGELTAELPTFKGTTIYEIATEIPATISGKYKKMEA